MNEFTSDHSMNMDPYRKKRT